MKKALLVCIVCLAMAIGVMTACSPSEDTHEHTFSTEWSMSTTQHWHKATCEHTGETKDRADHDFDENGVCKVCKYKRGTVAHEHNFTGDWVKSSEGHQRKCRSCDALSDLESHEWNDKGFCKKCGYKDAGEHEHDFSVWVKDATGHQKQCKICDDFEGPKEPHTWNDGEVLEEATCATQGSKKLACTVCGYEKVEPIPATGNHTFGEEWQKNDTEHWHICTSCRITEPNSRVAHTWGTPVVVEATCGSEGSTTTTCTVCSYQVTETIPATGEHSYDEKGLCSVCKDTNGPQKTDIVYEEKKEGASYAYLYMGTYPQTRVDDDALVARLNEKVGTPVSPKDDVKWSDSGYKAITNGRWASFMWYVSVYDGDDRYRGVYFDKSRPDHYQDDGLALYYQTQQITNGYSELSTTYWFKYEPIKWRILKDEGDSMFLMSDMILDAHEYNNVLTDRVIDGNTVYCNEYEYSSVREWLNGTFYNTVFDDEARDRILETEIENEYGGKTTVEQLGYNDTQDYVFLPSRKEVCCLNSNEDVNEYGFKGDIFNAQSTKDPNRNLKVTDYAKCQGAWCELFPNGEDEDIVGRGWWRLRDASYWNKLYDAICVGTNNLYSFLSNSEYEDDRANGLDVVGGGIAPAMVISASKDDFTHKQ